MRLLRRQAAPAREPLRRRDDRTATSFAPSPAKVIGMGDLTILLRAAATGDTQASEQVLPLVYETLRQMARHKMSRESPGHTLQPTALVHDAYLRLVKDKSARWNNRRHFFAAASEAMRRILIERARRVRRLRHGGHLERVPFDESRIEEEQLSERLLELDENLTRFEQHHPRKAQVVKLRYFVGMTIEETAQALDISPATVKEDWRFARAWLNRKSGEPTSTNTSTPSADAEAPSPDPDGSGNDS